MCIVSYFPVSQVSFIFTDYRYSHESIDIKGRRNFNNIQTALYFFHSNTMAHRQGNSERRTQPKLSLYPFFLLCTFFNLQGRNLEKCAHLKYFNPGDKEKRASDRALLDVTVSTFNPISSYLSQAICEFQKYKSLSFSQQHQD